MSTGIRPDWGGGVCRFWLLRCANNTCFAWVGGGTLQVDACLALIVSGSSIQQRRKGSDMRERRIGPSLFAVITAMIALVLSIAPRPVWADGNVAKIGDTEYVSIARSK